MVDHFKSMTELFKHTKENVDWKIVTQKREGQVLITAVHGGAIERGTSELAELLAEKGQFNFYSFKAQRHNHNQQLHVTSEHFDEPTLLHMIQEQKFIISLHGCKGTERVAYIGGKDTKLGQTIEKYLNEKDIKAEKAPKYISGMGKENFVNKSKREAGVQIEMTEPLRKHLFKNQKYDLKNRENRDNWSQLMDDFADAIIRAIEDTEQ